jgi:hypothetical protein
MNSAAPSASHSGGYGHSVSCDAQAGARSRAASWKPRPDTSTTATTAQIASGRGLRRPRPTSSIGGTKENTTTRGSKTVACVAGQVRGGVAASASRYNAAACASANKRRATSTLRPEMTRGSPLPGGEAAASPRADPPPGVSIDATLNRASTPMAASPDAGRERSSIGAYDHVIRAGSHSFSSRYRKVRMP